MGSQIQYLLNNCLKLAILQLSATAGLQRERKEKRGRREIVVVPYGLMTSETRMKKSPTKEETRKRTEHVKNGARKEMGRIYIDERNNK